MLSSECNIILMRKKYMYPKFLLLPWQPLRKDKSPFLFPGDEHYLKFILCVCISLCTDGIGLSSSKGNTIAFCCTPEIHECLVKIKRVAWRFFTVATTSTNQSGIFFHFWSEHVLPFVFQLWFIHELQWVSWDCCKCNVITFYYTPEIHEFLVEVQGLTWIFFTKNPFVDIIIVVIIMVKNINVKPLTFTKIHEFQVCNKSCCITLAATSWNSL